MKRFPAVFVLLICFFFAAVPAKASGSQLIIINKKTNTLAFYDDGTLVKTFKVSTGKQNSYTPEGTFRIVNKIKNRPYYTRNIPGGDPRNPLGDRWMGLDARGTYGTTYAIHGNSNPSTIGGYVSLGCVRMYNEEIHWLFEQVELYTTVIITNTDKSFDEVALAGGYNVAIPTSAGSTNKKITIQNGWVQAGNKTYYYMDGSELKGWQEIEGKRYFFDGHGVMMTGWMSDGGGTFYFNDEGVMAVGWHGIDGRKYYFGGDGTVQTGWRDIEGSRFFLGEDGAMKTGWLEKDGSIYYFNGDGAMQIGWVEVDGKWHYLGSDGVMRTGWINDKGKWYYLNSSGYVDPALTAFESPVEGSNSSWLDPSLERYFQNNTPLLVMSWIKYENRWYYLNVEKTMAESALED